MPGKSIRERVYWSLRLHGWQGTSVSIFSTIAGKFGFMIGKSEWYHQFLDRCFDRKLGTETFSPVEVSKLSVSQELKAKLVEYYPSPALELCMVLSRLDPEKRSFVDLGCGKGKAIIIASLFPFARVIGVELCPTLSQVAIDNVVSNRLSGKLAGPISILNDDATACPLPETDLLIYLFNPFDADLLKAALANIENCLKSRPRNAFILYSNPVHRELLDQSKKWQECVHLINGFENWCALYEYKKE